MITASLQAVFFRLPPGRRGDKNRRFFHQPQWRLCEFAHILRGDLLLD